MNGSGYSDNVLARFWAKVQRGSSDECWPWQATRTGGYGMFRISVSKHARAHRFSYELAFGPIPDGMFVCHRCDNPPCCNPAHLFLGTPEDNAFDSAMKRRMHPQTNPETYRGERNGRARVSASDVPEIRRLAASGVRRARIAEAYGISRETVTAITTGKSWAHIPMPTSATQAACDAGVRAMCQPPATMGPEAQR